MSRNLSVSKEIFKVFLPRWVTGIESVPSTYFDIRMKMRQLGLAIVKKLFVNGRSFKVDNQRKLNLLKLKTVLSKVFMMDAADSVRMIHCVNY